MPLIWIRTDAAGARPLMMNDGDDLSCADGVDWRFVAEVPNRAEGERLLAVLRRECGQHDVHGPKDAD